MKKFLLLFLTISLILASFTSCALIQGDPIESSSSDTTDQTDPEDPISGSDGLECKFGSVPDCPRSNIAYLGSCEEEHIIVPTYDENGEFIWGIDFTAENNGNVKSIRFMEGREILYGSTKCPSLETVEFPKDLKILGADFLSHCTGLKSVTLPDGIRTITSLFNGCSSLEEVKLPKNLDTIGRASFASCTSLKEIDIPDSVVIIDIAAFYNCSSLESIELPDKLGSIKEEAFFGCSSLKSIELPESILYIGERAFGNCISLEAIYVPFTIEKWNALSKHEEWAKDLRWPAKIVCTDGEIPYSEIMQ